jgi:hypothetical protein
LRTGGGRATSGPFVVVSGAPLPPLALVEREELFDDE